MPGFMQFLAGTYLFLGLTLFGTFKSPPLYMAALAFTAFGVHWFALGWIRLRRADARASIGMTSHSFPRSRLRRAVLRPALLRRLGIRPRRAHAGEAWVA